jgi:glutamate synthase (NADPH/NADH) small chain
MLGVPGRELRGIHFAMDYLERQNRCVAGETSALDSARGMRVVVIGGGDTGSDCAGVAIRQGATSVMQFELLPRPPIVRAASTPWPLWPMQLRSSHAHEEGCERKWEIATTAFLGDERGVSSLQCVRIDSGEAFTITADLVLLAMGFTVGSDPLLSLLGVDRDARGGVATDGSYRTSRARVYAAGDVRRGASLIVWAIREGRDAATSIDRDLRGMN